MFIIGKLALLLLLLLHVLSVESIIPRRGRQNFIKSEALKEAYNGLWGEKKKAKFMNSEEEQWEQWPPNREYTTQNVHEKLNTQLHDLMQDISSKAAVPTPKQIDKKGKGKMFEIEKVEELDHNLLSFAQHCQNALAELELFSHGFNPVTDELSNTELKKRIHDFQHLFKNVHGQELFDKELFRNTFGNDLDGDSLYKSTLSSIEKIRLRD